MDSPKFPWISLNTKLPIDPDDPSEMNNLTRHEYSQRIRRWLDSIKESNDTHYLQSEAAKLKNYCHFASVLFGSGDFRFIRARKNTNPLDSFIKASELWHPPANYVSLGRANLTGQPVLYLSNSSRVAISEIRANEGDTVTVATYKIKKNRYINAMEVGVLGYCKQRFAVELDESVLKTLRNCGYSEQGIGNLRSLRDFLRNEFLRDENEDGAYKITSALVQDIYKEPNLDGVLYASKQSPDDWNIAIKPQAARRSVVLTSCDKMRIEKYSDKEIIVSPIESSTSVKNGKILWAKNIEENIS